MTTAWSDFINQSHIYTMTLEESDLEQNIIDFLFHFPVSTFCVEALFYSEPQKPSANKLFYMC